MIRFLHPEAFLLALPMLVLMVRGQGRRPLVIVLRAVLVFLALCLLAEPYVAGSAEGRDLILVVDRSRSMPEGALAKAEEIAEQARGSMRPGDRIGLVTFGRDAAVESEQRTDFSWRALSKEVDRDGTDLANAIDTALALVPPDRRGSLVVISDGESTGASPAPAARDALRRGLRIDAFHLQRTGMFDVAVDELQTPAEVGAGQPFQFSTWIRADRPAEVPVRLLRDGEVIVESRRKLRAGLNRLVFRDVLAAQGVHRYEVDVPLAEDLVTENNRARAVVRATGPQRVLCITPGGRQDRLTRSLRGAGLRVVVTAPQAAPVTANALDGFRAVVLENVAAGDLPSGALARLASFVRDFGGGLLMTGGGASFGPGGYHRSAIESVLPVSMEIRQEERKFNLAMAVALDRSGSMRAPAGSGRTKMDLANLGTCAAIELLGPRDAVAVIAVDSAPHVVVPMRDVADVEPILQRVRTIESMGGGIFVGVALEEAARELAKAPQSNKHIVLFADAADAEEPGRYKTFVPELVKAGVTISVIGLGDKGDADGALLEEIARLGKGRCFFVKDPADLPRVFAQETIQVARSSMVEEPTALVVQSDVLAISPLLERAMPQAGGYSIAYLEDNAQLGARTDDDQKAPFFAFWQHGLGRSAAFLGEADGELSGGFAKWPGYGDFFATVVRWLAGNEATGEVWADLKRVGHEAVLSVEIEEGKEALAGALEARIADASGAPRKVLLQRTGERRYEARIPLRAEGVYRAVVSFGKDRFVRVPPITLPYSPEFERGLDTKAGEKLLRRVTRIAEGRLDPGVQTLFEGDRASRGVTALGVWCALLAVLFLLAEIAVRRLQVVLPSVRLPAALRRKPPSERPAEREAASADPKPAAPAAAEEPDEGIASVLDRARARGRRT